MNQKTLKQFPIFHHYLTAILLKTGLAQGSCTHIFNTISKYEVLDYCRCGDPCCSTVNLYSPTLIDKDTTLATPYNKAWVIINFYPNGHMEIENLADNEEYSFPFKQEIIDVFDCNPLLYTDDYAQGVVKDFMDTLEPLETHAVVV